MQQQASSINPDIVCQQAIQAKLFVYQAREQFDLDAIKWTRVKLHRFDRFKL